MVNNSKHNPKQGDVMQKRKIKIQGVEHFRDVKRVLIALGYSFPNRFPVDEDRVPVDEDRVTTLYANNCGTVCYGDDTQPEGFFDEHAYPEYKLVVEQVGDEELHYRLSRVARKMSWEWEVRKGFLCIVDKHISSPIDNSIIAYVFNLEESFAIQRVRETLERKGYTLSPLSFDENGAVIFNNPS